MGLIEDFLNQHDPNSYDNCERLRLNFISEYPIERIPSLSLEEYCRSGHDDTFCYKLEYGLQPLSSMGDMHIDGYGVYINTYNQPKVYRSLQKDFGDDYKAAFTYEKEEIVKLLRAGADEDYDAIRRSRIQQQFRFKLLSVYYPDKFFPVCTMKAATAYCECVGVNTASSDTMTELNLNLVRWKRDHLPAEWHLYQAMALSDWLWRSKKKLPASFNIRDNGKEIADRIEREVDALNLVGETREAVVKQRVNQGVFRERLMSKYSHCCLCNVDNEQVLVASHIKPWSESLPEERLDMDNGFLMCPNHDKVFDRGLISFDDDGQILTSSRLTDQNKMFLNIRDEIKVELSDGNRKYLQYHREHIFQK